MNGRWWESYLVRYFPGFVVGCVCVVVIIWKIGFFSDFNSKGFKLSDLMGYEFKSQEWILIALLGFLYTYIVSAPITIFHYFRMIAGGVRCFSESFWINWSFVLSLVIIFFFFVKNSITEWILLASLSAPAFYVLLSQYFLLVGTLNESNVLYFFNLRRISFVVGGFLRKKIREILAPSSSCQNSNSSNDSGPPTSVKKDAENEKDLSAKKLIFTVRPHPTLDEIEDGYFELVKSRMQTKSSDYRETYSHLREHANAIFIFLLCLSLMFLFIFIIDIYNSFSAQGGGSESGKIFIIVGLILVWILPNIYLWGFANRLESKFPDFFKYSNDNNSPRRED